MQKNYFYNLVAPIGKNFDSFFTPDLFPKKMLDLGIFKGKYCNNRILEFPKEWFFKALKVNKLSPERSDTSCNLIGIKLR